MDISLPPAGIQSPVLSGSTTTQKKHGVLILHRLYWIPQETPIFRKWIISCATQSRSVTSTDPWMSYFDWIFCNCLDLHRSSKIFKILWWSEPQHRAAIVIIVPSFRVLERPQDRSLWWGKLVMCAAVSEGAVMGAFEVLVKRSRMLMKRQVLLSGVVLMYQGGIKVRNGRELTLLVPLSQTGFHNAWFEAKTMLAPSHAGVAGTKSEAGCCYSDVENPEGLCACTGCSRVWSRSLQVIGHRAHCSWQILRHTS